MSKLLIAVILVLIIGGAIYFEFRRGSSMQAVANRLGFSFHPGQHPVSESLSGVGFDLFSQGPPNISNRMEGRRGDDRIAIFDFSWRNDKEVFLMLIISVAICVAASYATKKICNVFAPVENKEDA